MNISYVVPTLNSAATLDMTLMSLRSQKNVNVNIIVVDSGSTDGTLDICKRWNVKTLYAEPGNMYRAINVGLRECDTEWLGYINSDDWLYPIDSVSRLINRGNDLNADVVYGNCDYTDFHSRFMYSFAPPKPSQLNSISKTAGIGFAQQTGIFRNSLYRRLNGFNEDYKFIADREFYVRAIQSGASFVYLSGSPVACFRLHQNQLSQAKSHLMQEEDKKIRTEFLNPPSLNDKFRKIQWQLNNIPHYLIRFLRQSLLSSKLTIMKSMHSGTHY